MSSGDVPPNTTIYPNNLNEKIKIEEIQVFVLTWVCAFRSWSDSQLVYAEDDGLWCEEDFPNDGSDARLNKSSELDREWKRRHNQFHTIGYRDGLTAGKESSVQEGFNSGFKQSVLVGFNWGSIRGITSALVYLPEHLREKLVGTLEKRNRLQDLYESVNSISTKDAFELFQNDIRSGSLEKFGNHSKGDSHVQSIPVENSDYHQLGSFLGKLDSLQLESPAIKLCAILDRKTDA